MALARIFARSPKVLLLDEPFSALDTFFKWKLQCEVSKILKHYEGTALFVAHSRNEVFVICEHVAIINEGRIDRIGAFRNIFAKMESISATKLTDYKNNSRIKPLRDHCFETVDWRVCFARTFHFRRILPMRVSGRIFLNQQGIRVKTPFR